MKRGKEDNEQPMFPRLHVNDAADKSGPRAPPRNKMALYEQLSIPTQRFNHRLPMSHTGISNLVSPTSSSQGSGYDRKNIYPPCLRPAPADPSKMFTVHKPDAAKNSPSNSQIRPRKRAQAEEDLTVLVFIRFKNVRGQSGTNRTTSDQPMKTLNTSKKDLRQDPENPEAHDANSDRLLDEYLVQSHKHVGSMKKNDSCEGEVPKMAIEGNNENLDLSRGKTRATMHVDVCKRGSGISEATMIYSESGVDISPDHIVGLIGQKQFWKARRVLVNQQRVFAVQVFELHRLIKVQQLIAGSPHLLLEDISPKVLPHNKLNVEITKSPVQNMEPREDSEKQGMGNEQSTENGVLKTSFYSEVRSQRPPAVNTHFNPVAPGDCKAGFWAYHQQQPPKHQWLIPVMSPEGLVYKPYPGLGYIEPFNGQGPAPFMNSFARPVYGVPAQFPTYGASIRDPDFSGSSVEQIHRFHQWSEEDPDSRNPLQHQSSCNEQRQKPGPAPFIEMFWENEVQGSTGSSPSERAIEAVRGALPLFPMAPRMSGRGCDPPESSQQPTRVIKVIPHNRRSATESAARIFQSIQEERKLHE
ncbi:hypothetical protein SAY86_027712 [Trapa natans]|uniref:Uncharacterized protein n=1 Tax=Trapa natans TaxID=22666 RepID=A0AAN7QJ90_TRANT|nr:hypothetical protein SAY86_027712 [Trapa natans]